MYDVYLEGSAAADLKRLPKDVFVRAVTKIRSLSHNPRPPGCRKITGSQNDWRIRIGDYRVVYEIDDKTDLLYIRLDDRKQQVVDKRISEHIVLDIGEDDRIVGIEILDASKRVRLEALLPVSYKLSA